jgi:DNA-binding LytR/AlgR family response regulator
VAIDDEPLALTLLQQYIAQFPNLLLLKTFDDAISGVEFLRENKVDLLFVDINMPDLNGLDLVSSLQQKPMVIFTTAYRKFAADAFDLDALDYLLKPIDFERFSKTIQKATEYYQYLNQARNEAPMSLFIKAEYKVIKIELNDIAYIEGLEDYIKIHLLSTNKPILTLMTLKGILEKLPPKQFSRIHRSYIVSHQQVKSIQNRKVQLKNSKELPISDSYLDFIQAWQQS